MTIQILSYAKRICLLDKVSVRLVISSLNFEAFPRMSARSFVKRVSDPLVKLSVVCAELEKWISKKFNTLLLTKSSFEKLQSHFRFPITFYFYQLQFSLK